MASKIAATFSPRNGRQPVAISYKTIPNENRSARASSSFERACSGDIYGVVPNVAPGIVNLCGSSFRVVSVSPS